PARDGVADDEDIGACGDALELCRTVAFGERDAERGKLRAHRWIDVGVAARHGVPGGASESGQPTHECTADAEDMEMHGSVLHCDFNANARSYAASSERV